MTQPEPSADPPWEKIHKYASWILDDLQTGRWDVLWAREIIKLADYGDPGTLQQILIFAKNIYHRNDGVYLPVASMAEVIINEVATWTEKQSYTEGE